MKLSTYLNKYLLGIAIILFSTTVNAQFYVGVQSGIANIKSDTKGVTEAHNRGGAIKAGYVYSLTDHIGIGSGIEFAQYKQSVTLSQGRTTLTNFEVDASGSAFVYNVTAENYRENQTLQAIQIPLFLQYKKNINKGIDFNFKAGIKYFLTVKYKIESTATSVKGSGY